jgi:DNA-binding LacI/PurR family transcriptional regulator
MPTRKLTSTSKSTTSRASTLADVARRAGVTKSTASFAFSGKRKISDATKKRIFAIAKELGYKPNPHAQRLGAGRAARLVGLFALTLDHMAWKTMSQLHHDLMAKGYEAPLYTYGYSEEVSPNPEVLLSAICGQQPEGIICNTFKLLPKDCPVLEEYQQKGGALVCLSSEVPLACDQVIFDREENTYLSANYLLKAGHRDIGFCTFSAADFSLPRPLGFLRALKEYGVKLNPRWLFEAGHDEDGGAMLAETFLKLKKRPSALCIVNDMQAATFVHKMLRAGVRVPEDISVVSLDNMPAAQHGMVALTAATQPWPEMGKTAVRFLLERMQQTVPLEPRKIIFSGEIIERESVLRIK